MSANTAETGRNGYKIRMTPDRPALPRRKVFEAESSALSGPFWEATRRRELVLPWCVQCERAIWFPREMCPTCRGTVFDWRPASGVGEVYAVSVGRGADDGAY